MRSKLARAALWSIGGTGTQYVVVFLLFVYLARVLEPRDFGLMATVAVGLDLGTRIARWGQVELLQQAQHRNSESRNQSFRLSLAIAIGCTLLFLLAARPLGSAFGSPQLTQMIYLCAPVFLWSATGSTAEAILRSEFRFGAMAIRNTVATIIGGAVAIILTMRGHGALALAAQRLVQATIAGFWIWTAVDWRPRLRGPWTWSADLVADGGRVMVGTILPLVVPRSMDFFVGFTLGAAQLGLLRLAFRVNEFVGQLVVMPLVSVANAHLANADGDMAAMRRSYLRLTQASAALMCPALIGMSLVAPEAVPILFGDKWRASIAIVQIVGLLGLVAPVNYYFAAAMVALGQSRRVLRQGVFQMVIGVVLAAAAAQISLIAIAIAHVVRGVIVSAYNLVDLQRQMGLGLAQLWQYMAAPYVGTLVMAAVVSAARELLGGTAPFVRLVVLAGVGGLAYAGTIWCGDRLGVWPAHASLIPARLRRRS